MRTVSIMGESFLRWTGEHKTHLAEREGPAHVPAGWTKSLFSRSSPEGTSTLTVPRTRALGAERAGALRSSTAQRTVSPLLSFVFNSLTHTNRGAFKFGQHVFFDLFEYVFV